MYDHELVGLTIEQLIKHFKLSPESFSFSDRFNSATSRSIPTIMWQPRIQLKDYLDSILDPNNSGGIMVSWNPYSHEVTCYLFTKTPLDINLCNPDNTMSSKRWFEKYRSNYKRFKQLKNLIRMYEQHKDSIRYLKKLSAVFPDLLDHHILKD